MRFRGALATALGCAAAATVCLSPGRAVAQSAPVQSAPLPSAPTREEVDRPELRRDGERRGGRVSVEGEIERAPCPLDEPRYQEMRVTIGDVRFTGLRGVSAETLMRMQANYEMAKARSAADSLNVERIPKPA